MSLIGNLLNLLAESVLISLGITSAASAKDAAIHKKNFWSGHCPSDWAKQTTLKISNEEMNYIMKIIK